MKLPTPNELQSAWKKVQEIHRQYLAVHGVRLPNADYYSESNKAVWLAVLYLHKDRDEDTAKDEISAIVQRDVAGAASDQQVRHLKRDGWEIGQGSGRHRLDPYKVSQEFQNQSARKRAQLNAGSFDELKKAFGFRCATCGATEGRPDSRYGDAPVSLQQGHKDPHEDGDNINNIIPQCQFCNQAYKNDFTFDSKGRVHAVASPGPVIRASQKVKKQILEWLQRNCGG